MISIAERGFRIFRDSPEKAARQAEKRARIMQEDVARSARSVSNSLKQDLGNLTRQPSIDSLTKVEQDFLLKIQINEDRVAGEYVASNEERATNSRLFAFTAIDYLSLQTKKDKSRHARSFTRCARDVGAWGIGRTEDLTGTEVDTQWALGFLSKLLNGSLTSEDMDMQTFLKNPPRAVRTL